MRRRLALGVVSPWLGLLPAGVARAESPVQASGRFEPPPAVQARGPTALVTGLAVAGLSFGVGGFLLTMNEDLGTKHAGLAVLHGGLTVAPLAAHGVSGEWSRGALFAVAPALGGIGMAALLAWRPQTPVMGKDKSHRIYPVLITASVLGSAIGIFDAALVDERSAVNVSAAVSPDFGGATVEGRF
ncbi:MAG TPA: hypothetical protein VGK73_12045 [Polyangiaceae bacterium]